MLIKTGDAQIIGVVKEANNDALEDKEREKILKQALEQAKNSPRPIKKTSSEI
jgi:glutamyl-tRNA reductase